MPTSGDVPKSPFFRPSEPQPTFTRTPGGTKHKRKVSPDQAEHKSTVIGCSANLINTIVGSGIVGLPYAIKQAGFAAGIILVILCAILTEKSLRLLIETAKHVHVPTYEMVSEVAFGRYGFLFVAINMFIMAYGAMLSYLMIVKDTYSSIFGVASDDYPTKRAILFIVSITIMFPISSQRDMADLAKTSRLNVIFDIIMVFLVVYIAPISETLESLSIGGTGTSAGSNSGSGGEFSTTIATTDYSLPLIKVDTLFVGVGVLSFAFVCQHSAFIIAGSLDKPTKERWSTVTRIALLASGSLALLCGISGYLGYGELTQGNILNNLDDTLFASKLAKVLLGTTMLFVYPMESFVCRHVCVVLFFQGRKAHEGDDSSVLNRRDRRITLTGILYLMAVLPAAVFTNLGNVLGAFGAVGGSCLSYIGPGSIYLGIHGSRFLELSRYYFGNKRTMGLMIQSSTNKSSAPNNIHNDALAANEDDETAALYKPSTPSSASTSSSSGTTTEEEDDSFLVRLLKSILWYVLLMPIWCWIASLGRSYLTTHVHDLAMKSPHPIRIGNVRFASAQVRGGATRVVMLQRKQQQQAQKSPLLVRGSGGSDVEEQHHHHQPTWVSSAGDLEQFPTEALLIRADSLPRGYGTARTAEGHIVALPAAFSKPDFSPSKLAPPKKQSKHRATNSAGDYGSINQNIGRALAEQQRGQQQQQQQQKHKSSMSMDVDDEELVALEDDPQQIPPGVWDFAVAIFYIVFGVVAMVAGLVSLSSE